MTDHSYDTAYLSLAVPPAGDLLAIQREVCGRYALIPRPEVHLTIAFLGKNTARRLVDLVGTLLDDVPGPEFARIRVDGLGGAYERAGELRLIRGEAPQELANDPRVLWLAAATSPELKTFRDRVIRAAAAVGITTPVPPDFFPHLTLGSAGPPDRGNWTLWDVHTVPKRATIDRPGVPAEVRASKLHVTDVATHPDSIHLLRPFAP